MSENKKYSAIYLNFLNLTQTVREMPNFPAIDPVEEYLLNMLASLWHQDKKIKVLEAMSLNAKISSTTLHRRLMCLRSKGLIALEVSERDSRIKYVSPTDLTQEYFAALGRALVATEQGFRSDQLSP
jgi:DNA-binding transcriptional ArsR family regulator